MIDYKSMFDVSGKIVLIIGGTSGIGRAMTDAFDSLGSIVIPVSSNQEKIKKTLIDIGTEKYVPILPTDVTDESSVNATVEAIVKKYKRIDVLINCAGVHLKKPAENMTVEEWNKVINVNLTGTFVSNKCVGKQMISQNYGRIINIASLGSYVGLTEALAYCASKGGVVSLTKELAIEWAKYNINVNAIAPGVFKTSLNEKVLAIPERAAIIIGRTPYKRYGNVSELTGAAVYLSSVSSAFVTGSIIKVDGGFLAYGI